MSAPTRVERLRQQAGLAAQVPAKLRKPLGRGLAAMMMDVPQPPAETTGMITLVPLSRLHVSPRNSRLTRPDEDIDWLANDIHENGLLQNLVVVPEEDGLFGPGDLGVVEGGRRYRALTRNVELERITVDQLVPVLVKDADDGRMLSLLSAIHKIDLNPADQFAAYAAIVEEHSAEPDPIAYCSGRCGVSEHHVRQRLRLAALAPEILDKLRAGELTLEAAEAYAGFDDQALQLHVFMAEEGRSFPPKHQARNIRDQLRSRTYPATIAQATYVGIEAYVAAGGRTDRDLFFGLDDGERLLDPSLLDELARRKAAAEVGAIAAADGFAEGRLATSFAELPIWPRAAQGFIALHSSTWPKTKRDRPAGAVGVYTLNPAGDGLQLGQWWKPVVVPVPTSSAPASIPDRAADLARAEAEIERHTPAGAASRVVQLQTRAAAARLAVERTLGDAIAPLTPYLRWAEQGDILQSVTEDGDPDTCLVALWVRVPRSTLESALTDTEQQLEETVAC